MGTRSSLTCLTLSDHPHSKRIDLKSREGARGVQELNYQLCAYGPSRMARARAMARRVRKANMRKRTPDNKLNYAYHISWPNYSELRFVRAFAAPFGCPNFEPRLRFTLSKSNLLSARSLLSHRESMRASKMLPARDGPCAHHAC